MKDNLQDLIEHTHGLGVIDLIKVTGSTSETKISAISEDKTVIVEGSFKNPNAEFIGTFGMPNLSKLKTILGFDDYDEHATINVTRVDRNGVSTPEAIHFETKDKSFVNDYRFMLEAIVNEKVKSVVFKGATWNVEFKPTVAGIMRLKKQAHQKDRQWQLEIRRLMKKHGETYTWWDQEQ